MNTFDPLAPEAPPQNDLEQLLEDDAPLADLLAVLLTAHLGMPGREDETGGFAPEVREFEGGPAVLAFTHPVRVDRWLAVAGRPEGRLVAHAAEGRALFGQLLDSGLPLMLNAASGTARIIPLVAMQAALAVRE